MLTKEITVKNNAGLHARSATLLVKKASSFKSDITIEYEGKGANIKSLIGVLSLGVKKDARIKIITSGADEKYALEEIARLIESLE